MEHPIRKYLGPVGLAVGLTVGGAAAGAYEGMNTPATIQVGPHQAEAEITLDSTYTVDFGPIGSITKPNTQNDVGAKIIIKDIPTQPGDPADLDYAAIATQYKQLFSDPEHVVNRARHEMIGHLLGNVERGALLGLGLGSLVALGAMAMSDERKWHIRASVEGLRPRVVTAVVLAGLAANCMPSTAAALPTIPKPPIDHVFDGSPLEGASVHGAYMQAAVDRIAPEVIGYVEDTQSYFDKARDNFVRAFGDRPELDKPDEQVDRLLVISDTHCDIGMYRVIDEVASSFKVKLAIDAGDMVMFGTIAEAECVAGEADAFGDLPKFVAMGNHDDPEVTGFQARENGFIVANGDVQEVAGYTILGDSDPRRSGLFSGDIDNNDPRIARLGQQLAKSACENEPDIVVVHDPKAALATNYSGCTHLTISGHTHTQAGPQVFSDGKGNITYAFTQGTSGGAKPNSLTLGELKSPAVMSVFEIDKNTHMPLGRYDVIIDTNGSAQISKFIPVPNR